MPNCSAMTSGAWLGSMIPPAPTRMVRVFDATCSMRTLVADDAMLAMLWCSAYQTRRYPSSSARCATLTLAAKASRGGLPRADEREVEDGEGHVHGS